MKRDAQKATPDNTISFIECLRDSPIFVGGHLVILAALVTVLAVAPYDVVWLVALGTLIEMHQLYYFFNRARKQIAEKRRDQAK